MKFAWNDDYLVEVKELDQQHQQLMGMIRNLETLNAQNNIEETVYKTLDDLMEYVMIHFSTEEKYMESIGFDDLERHRELHHKLSDEVAEKVNEVVQRTPSALDVIMLRNYLMEWIQEHIRSEDQSYRKFIRQQQLR